MPSHCLLLPTTVSFQRTGRDLPDLQLFLCLWCSAVFIGRTAGKADLSMFQRQVNTQRNFLVKF